MADTLSPKSRKFYERTRTKMAVSIFLGSMAMLCLAYCSAYGGQSDNANYYKKHSNNDTDEAAFQSLVGGFGKDLGDSINITCHQLNYTNNPL